jgi:hypothetical protein
LPFGFGAVEGRDGAEGQEEGAGVHVLVLGA